MFEVCVQTGVSTVKLGITIGCCWIEMVLNILSGRISRLSQKIDRVGRKAFGLAALRDKINCSELVGMGAADVS